MGAAQQDFVFRLVADDTLLQATTQAAGKSLQDLGAQAVSVGQKQLPAVANTAKFTSQEIQSLTHAVRASVDQLSAGGSPFTVLIQQGGKLVSGFGGVQNVFSKLGTFVNPLTVGLAALAAAIGSVGYAFYKGAEQTDELNRSLALTGNFAGSSADQVERLSVALGDATGRGRAFAREAVTAVTSSGQFGPQSIEQVSAAVIQLQRLSGESADAIVKDFGSMSQGVAKWAAEHNRQYNYLTVAQYQYIRQLEAQGRTEEAITVNAKALTDSLAARNVQLGTLGNTLGKLKQGWKDFWDAAFDIGRPQTIDQKIDDLQKHLQVLQGAPQGKAILGPGDFAGYVFKGGQQYIDQQTQQTSEALQDLQRERFKDLDRQNEQAIAQQQVQEKIQESSKSFAETQISLERAKNEQLHALFQARLDDEQRANERRYQQMEESASAFRQRSIEIERARLADKQSAIDQEIAIEQRRVPENRQDSIAQQAKLIQLGTQRNAVLEERAKLEDRIRAGELDAKPRDVQNSPLEAFRVSEEAQSDAILKASQERRDAALANAHDLLNTNRQLNIDLIQDDRARGEAQIAFDEEQLRKRLDLSSLNADERKQVEESLAQWRIAREKQLTEQLKPQYQQELDLFADTMRYMKQESDSFHQQFIDSGRDAFTQWITTGKLSAHTLVQAIESEFAKMVYDKFLAQSVSNFAGNIFSAFAGAIGGGGGDAGASSAVGSGLSATGYSLAVGTNYVPYDGMRATLHEGEAVVPKAYNPAAGGRAPGGVDAPVVVNVHNNTGVQANARTQRRQDGSIDVMLDAVETGLAARVQSGSSILGRALAQRHGLDPVAGSPNRPRSF
jgi:hypothetical protein